MLDDAVLTDLSTEQLDAVLRAKADTAWHLHHLTTEKDLDAFVLFSSVVGQSWAPPVKPTTPPPTPCWTR